MTAGISTAVANSALGNITGTDMNDVALATGDPGTAGTTNPSNVTTRQSLTWGSASSASIAITNTPTWSSWAGTNGEVETYLTLWSASTSGTFGGSVALSASVTMDTGDTLEILSLSISLPTAT